MAISGPPLTLDPGLVTDNRSSQVVLNTFEGLMVFDKEAGPIKYGVAESYTVSDDGRIYEFKLRSDAKWSNGDPVTASDFVYAWTRALYPGTASQYAWLITDAARIKGAREYNTGRANVDAVGVRATDAQTLVVELDEAVPYFLDLMAFPTFAPVHKATVESGVDFTEAEHWVSNGPYVLSPDSSGRKLVLEPNKHYYDLSDLAFDRIEIAIIEDDVERIAAFDAGELDWTGPQELPLTEIQNLAARREFRQEAYLAVEYIVFNTTTKPLDDVRVRRAIGLAINRDDIVIKQLQGVGQAAYGFVPPMPGFSTEVRRKTDVDAAKKLLADAGYPDGKDFPTLTYLVPTGNRNAEAVGQLLKTQLADTLGIELVLESKPLEDLLGTVRAGEFMMTRSAWVGDFVDPASFLGLWTSDSAQNKAQWKSADYDALLDKAAAIRDRGNRYEIYEQAELMLDEAHPVTPLYYKVQTYLLRDSVEGFAPHKLNVHLLKYAKKSSK